MEICDVEHYFYMETKGLDIEQITLVETKYSYFDSIQCFEITTTQKNTFYVFSGDTTLTNIYPARPGASLNECYYMHVGFMAEYSSQVIHRNFLADFLKDTSVFPILDRRLSEIYNEISLDKNSAQLSGLANQIRDCYIVLSEYLMNKVRSSNPDFKQANFKSNLEEFLKIIIPGDKSKMRRAMLNSIAQKGWDFNCELVHKESVTVFDIMMSFNVLKLIISSVSNIVVGNDMPFNKIKCPKCLGEKHTMRRNSDSSDYRYECEDCGYVFSVPIDVIKKEF